MRVEEGPRVSVVVFARERVATLAETLRSLEHQERFADIEVILADGTAEGTLNDLLAGSPWIRRLRLPPGDMPTLKGHAIRAARADIVAILDPWDAAAPSWISEILDGLKDERVAAVGGAVLLNDAATAGNRVAYLFEYGACNPPLPAGPTQGDLPGNNVAYRRQILFETCGDILDRMGFNKPFCHERIRAAGYELVIRPSMQVCHLTAHRFLPFAMRRFHYGRCFGANRRRLSPRSRVAFYCVFAPIVPLLLVTRHLARAFRHPLNRRLLPRTGAALAGVCIFWGVGEWTGYWFGAGRSCDKLY